MAKPVSLEDVAAGLEVLSQDMRAYIHRDTGELILLQEGEAAFMEEGDDEALERENTDWDEDIRAKLREMAESGKWVPLPDSFEIHEREIMRDFAATLEDDSLRVEIVQALHGRGAFRYFKDTVHRHGLQEDWFRFKREALVEIAREALEEAGIPYR